VEAVAVVALNNPVQLYRRKEYIPYFQ